MSPAEKKYFDNIVADINLYWVPSQWFVSGLRDGYNFLYYLFLKSFTAF